MNTPTKPILPEYTPEEMAALYAKHKALFTAEDLLGYIEDDEPTYPVADVIAEVEELVCREEDKRQVRS